MSRFSLDWMPVRVSLRRKPVTLKDNEQAAQAKPDIVERGATGTTMFGGKLADEDYNTDLEHSRAITVYEKMRKSDGQVKAGLLACELPLRAATWEVIPASKSTQDIAVADFVSRNLFEGMTITWDDFLKHVFLMYPFGFSVFEKVFEIRDNQICWRKLAPRLPKSIEDFKLDTTGGLKEVTQWVWKTDTSGNSIYENVTLPVSKVLVFTLDREGSNYRGTSLLRAAYKHWYYKDGLYRIDAMAAERHGLGVPVFKYPPFASETDKNNIDAIGKRLHAHEKGYVALPNTYDFTLVGVTGQLHPIVQSIEHHDLQIVRSILAQFINLGSKEVGSYALSQDQSGFFLMALQAVGNLICDTMNRYGIRQLVDYNFKVAAYPKLQVSGLEVRDLGVWSKALADLVGAGAFIPDEQVEAEVRRVMRLPAKQAPTPKRATELSARVPNRSNRVNLAEVGGALDSSIGRIVQDVKAIQKRQIKNLVDQTVKLLRAGKVDKLQDVDVRYKGEVSTVVGRELLKLYEKGREDVKAELGVNNAK